MPKFRVPTEAGEFEVETDEPSPTDEQLLDLINAQAGAAGPGLLRRGAAFAARVGVPLVGGVAGAALGGPLGAAGGAAAGGAAGEALAETILGEEFSPTEIALSGGLAAVPAGPFARAAARPGVTIARRAALSAAEGAAQGALAAQAESLVREGEPAGIAQTAIGAAGGAVLGVPLGVALGARQTPARSTLTPDVPLSPQTEGAEVAQEAQGKLFRKLPGGAQIPPRSAVPDSRLAALKDRVDVQFAHLGEVERLSLKSLIDEQGDEILYHSRSVQSVERTRALADELYYDLSRPLPAGTAANAEQMEHATSIIGPLIERVTNLSGEVAARPDDAVLKLKLQHAQTRANNAIVSYSGLRTESGRTMNIQRQQGRALASGDTKAINLALKLGVPAERITKILSMSPDDPVSQYRQIRDSYNPDWLDKLKWYFYTNILSGPRTSVRNLVSNTVNLALRPATAPFAAAADVVGAKLTGRDREVFLGEAPVMLQQAYRALPEAWSKSLFMFRNGFSLSDVDDFEVRAPEMPGGIAVNLVSRSLAATDEFFRTLGFNMELHAGAFARARKQALGEGLDGQALLNRTADLTAELLDRKPKDLLDQADAFARRVTFQERDNPVASGLSAFRDAFPAGIGHFLVPFVRTVANIFRQGLHFSPAGFLTAGKGRAGQQRVGEAALGSTLLLPVAWLAATGEITGAAPTDPGERDAFYAEGKRPNSIRIGDTWVSYAEAGPLVLPFAVLANAADAWRRTGKFDEETAGAIVGQVARSTLEQSYLTSLSAVFEAWSDPERKGKVFIQNLASGLVPLVGLQRNVAQALDPTVRQARTFVEGLERNVPVVSKGLQPKLDAFGQEVTRPSGVQAFLAPQVSPAVVDPLRAELERIGVLPEPSDRIRELTVGDEKVPVSPDADLAIRRAIGAYRMILVRDLIGSPEYGEITDEERSTLVQRELRKATSLATGAARDLLTDGEPVTFEALTEGLEGEPAVSEQRAPSPAPAPPSPPLAGGPATDLDEAFSAAAAASTVDPTFLKAVAKVESGFDPDARGPATRYGTAIGPMQVLPSTFRLYEAEARRLLGREPVITNPTDNILVGALLYRDHLNATGDDPTAAATLYHGGTDPRNHGPKTRAYAKKVAETYAQFTGGAP